MPDDQDPDEYVMSYKATSAPEHRPADRGGSKVLSALADRTPRPRAKRMLTDLFGKANRGDGPDTAKAAEELGVGRRTVQRWLSEGLPGARSSAAQDLSSRWQQSPAGRKASISPQRRRHLISSGFKGKVRGQFRVSAKDKQAKDNRWVSIDLTPSETQALYEASLLGDREAHAQLEQALSGPFGGSVSITHLTDMTQD